MQKLTSWNSAEWLPSDDQVRYFELDKKAVCHYFGFERMLKIPSQEQSRQIQTCRSLGGTLPQVVSDDGVEFYKKALLEQHLYDQIKLKGNESSYYGRLVNGILPVQYGFGSFYDVYDEYRKYNTSLRRIMHDYYVNYFKEEIGVVVSLFHTYCKNGEKTNCWQPRTLDSQLQAVCIVNEPLFFYFR